MRIIADLHLHSKYSRATSGKMVIPEIARWANLKGIDLIGTGDFTHPLWLAELKRDLIPLNNGFYFYKNNLLEFKTRKSPRFILSAEISSIYSSGGRVRKIHNVVLAPSIETAEKINQALSKIGNLHSDGRPILGLSAHDLAKIILNIDSRCMIIPAHIWTPWFSLFGANSGFDTLEECFGDLSKYIYAGETGLSSDAAMNWRLEQLDKITLISNSDAHSPANLGREANVFEVESDNYSYDYVAEIIRAKDPRYFRYTIEFFPEEGKYHFDGHRSCGIKFHPDETKKNNGICPKCHRPLTIGVYNRVTKLANRPEGYKDNNFPSEIHLIPLQEIIAESMGVSKASKKVQEEYLNIVNIHSEFAVLLDLPQKELENFVNPKIVRGIINMREGRVKAIAGYDGVYGVIKVFENFSDSNSTTTTVKKQKKQNKLF